MITPENDNFENEENEENKKTVYKETEDRINDKEEDAGDTSSVADLGRTDFIQRPTRSNTSMGSSHEPGTL
jgi:hypothetical protein